MYLCVGAKHVLMQDHVQVLHVFLWIHDVFNKNTLLLKVTHYTALQNIIVTIKYVIIKKKAKFKVMLVSEAPAAKACSSFDLSLYFRK